MFKEKNDTLKRMRKEGRRGRERERERFLCWRFSGPFNPLVSSPYTSLGETERSQGRERERDWRRWGVSMSPEWDARHVIPSHSSHSTVPNWSLSLKSLSLVSTAVYRLLLVSLIPLHTHTHTHGPAQKPHPQPLTQ